MRNRTLMRVGIGGTIIAALCCFTPVLVVLLSALGLAGFTGYLDVVLFPVLFAFLGLTAYAFWRTRQAVKNGS